MNARAAVVFWLVLFAPGCAHAPTSARDEVLQTALDASVLGCQTALNDPATVWGPGAQAYCRRLLNGCQELPP